MSTSAWAAIAALIASIATLIAQRSLASTARAKLVQEIDERRRADAAADKTAHTDAQTAMATISERLAQSSYAYADRLRVDLDRMRQVHADEMQAATTQIADLRQRVADQQEELQILRAKVALIEGVK